MKCKKKLWQVVLDPLNSKIIYFKLNLQKLKIISFILIRILNFKQIEKKY